MKPINKTKTVRAVLLSAAGLVLAAILLVTGIFFYRRSRLNGQIGRQNYVASKLLELGSYENGQILAMQSEQMKSNAVSRELIVLSAGFSSDYAFGISCADTYLKDSADPLLSEIRELLADGERESGLNGNSAGWEAIGVPASVQSQAYRDDLLRLLLRIQSSIDVKKSGPEIQAMVDLYSGKNVDGAAFEALTADHSPASRRLQTVYAMNQGRYDDAAAAAEELYAVENTLETRSLLASLMASGNISSEVTGIPVDPEFSERQQTLETRHITLYQQYVAEPDSARQQILRAQLESVEEELAALRTEAVREPAARAVNFLISQTPASEKKSAAYRLICSYLQYQAGSTVSARSVLQELLRKNYDDSDPTAMLLDSLIDTYRSSVRGISDSGKTDALLTRIAKLLHLPGVSRYGTDAGTAFYGFFYDLLDQMYNGLIIRNIDTSAFPTVRVTINLPSQNTLKKGQLSLFDMNRTVRRFRLLSPEETSLSSACSVMLVVDRSGSMMGTRMSHTKASVISFTRSLDAGTDLGLVAFDDTASLLTPLGHSRSELLQNADRLSADGGTAIYSGLQCAGNELIAHGKARKIIILLSDGEDGVQDRIDPILEMLRANGIYVYTIGIEGANTAYLSYIANACGGKFFSVGSTGMLAEIYGSISEHMVNDYVLEFTAETELKTLSRHLQILFRSGDAVSDSDYHVGVPYASISGEDARMPRFDSFRQIGGSYTGAGTDPRLRQ